MNNLKKNFKEIGKDLKGIVCSAVSLVVDVGSIPISAVKDVRDATIKRKTVKDVENIEQLENEYVEKVVKKNKPRTKKEEVLDLKDQVPA